MRLDQSDIDAILPPEGQQGATVERTNRSNPGGEQDTSCKSAVTNSRVEEVPSVTTCIALAKVGGRGEGV